MMCGTSLCALFLASALLCAGCGGRAESSTGGRRVLVAGWAGYESGETGQPVLEFEVPAHAKDGAGCFATPVASDEFGNIYLAWLDPSVRLMVARKDPAGRVTTAVIEEHAGIDEDHFNASLGMDKYGLLHVVWGVHNSAWKYKVSRAPRDITAWDDIGPLRDGEAGNPRGLPGVAISYPSFFKDRDGDLFVAFRNRVSTKGWEAGDQSGGLARYAANADARKGRWTMLGGTNHPHAHNPELQAWGGRALLWTGFVGRPDSPAYQSYMISHAVGYDGRIHLAWALNDNTVKAWEVHQFGYAVSADRGETWAGADGQRFSSLPMTDTHYDEVVNDRGNVWYQMPFVFLDADGRPWVSAANARQRVMQWWHPTGSGWSRSDAGQGGSPGRVFSDGYGRFYTFGRDALWTTTDAGAHWTQLPVPSPGPWNAIPDYDYLYSTANLRYMAFFDRSVKRVYTIRFPGHVWKTAAPSRPKSLLFDGRPGGRRVDSVAALAWDMDFCYENGTLYLYSAAGTPSARWTHPGVEAVL
jgi:hypothetical protein